MRSPSGSPAPHPGHGQRPSENLLPRTHFAGHRIQDLTENPSAPRVPRPVPLLCRNPAATWLGSLGGKKGAGPCGVGLPSLCYPGRRWRRAFESIGRAQKGPREARLLMSPGKGQASERGHSPAALPQPLRCLRSGTASVAADVAVRGQAWDRLPARVVPVSDKRASVAGGSQRSLAVPREDFLLPATGLGRHSQVPLCLRSLRSSDSVPGRAPETPAGLQWKKLSFLCLPMVPSPATPPPPPTPARGGSGKTHQAGGSVGSPSFERELLARPEMALTA